MITSHTSVDIICTINVRSARDKNEMVIALPLHINPRFSGSYIGLQIIPPHFTRASHVTMVTTPSDSSATKKESLCLVATDHIICMM